NALWPYRAVGPGIHRMHVPYDPGVIPFAQLPDAVARGSLIAHLGYNLVARRSLRKLACCVDVVGRRSLHTHMFAHWHRSHRTDGVVVAAPGPRHGTAMCRSLAEQGTPVVIVLRLAIFLARLLRHAVVYVAEVATFGLAAIITIVDAAPSFTTDAYSGHHQLVAGRNKARAAQHVTRHNRNASSGQTGFADEVPAGLQVAIFFHIIRF